MWLPLVCSLTCRWGRLSLTCHLHLDIICVSTCGCITGAAIKNYLHCHSHRIPQAQLWKLDLWIFFFFFHLKGWLNLKALPPANRKCILKMIKIIFIHSFGPARSSGHSLDVSNHQCQQAAATQCNIITTLLCLSLNLGGGHNTLSMVLSARTCTWLASPSTKNDRHYFNVQHLFIFFLNGNCFGNNGEELHLTQFSPRNWIHTSGRILNYMRRL